MDRELYRLILQELRKTTPHLPIRGTYTDQEIVSVFYFAVLNNRPVSWACDRRNWPICYLSHGRSLPSQSQMSRRLRTASVSQLLDQIEQQVFHSDKSEVTSPFELAWYLDGRPLVVSKHSRDRYARFGRASRGIGRGYKLHLLLGCRGTIGDYRVTPMNRDERPMARRMLRRAKIQGYVLGDANYDDDGLHEICEKRGNLTMITPPRQKNAKGFGHRKYTASRRDCIQRQRDPFPEFVEQMMRQRYRIDTFFGQQTSCGEGLWSLPPWVRTFPRVYRWIQAKLALLVLRNRILALQNTN